MVRLVQLQIKCAANIRTKSNFTARILFRCVPLTLSSGFCRERRTTRYCSSCDENTGQQTEHAREDDDSLECKKFATNKKGFKSRRAHSQELHTPVHGKETGNRVDDRYVGVNSFRVQLKSKRHGSSPGLSGNPQKSPTFHICCVALLRGFFETNLLSNKTPSKRWSDRCIRCLCQTSEWSGKFLC